MGKNNRVNSLLLALSVVAVVAWVAIVEGGLVSSFYISDSVNYMRLAENIKAGNWMNQHGLAGKNGWFAVWPVGYPALLAAFSSVFRIESFWASKVFSVVCSVSLLTLFWECARRQFPILALMLLNLAYLKISRGTLSEQPFIVLMACLGFAVDRIVRCEESELGKESVRRIVLLALSFTGLFLIRYVGAIAPVWAGVAVVVALMADRKEVGLRVSFRRILEVSIAAFVAWMIESVYLLVNRAMCGFVSGYERPVAPESAQELIRMTLAAEFHELQAYGICLFLGLVLVLLCRMHTAKHDKTGALESPYVPYPSGLVFVTIGIMFHATMIVMRSRHFFNPLGFRLLYPGTFLVTIGCILIMSQKLKIDWMAMLGVLPRRVVAGFCVILTMFGVWLLHGELQLRGLCGISVYGKGDPYQVVKKRVLEKYSAVPSGSAVKLQCDFDGEDFLLAYLRPDLMVNVTLPE